MPMHLFTADPIRHRTAKGNHEHLIFRIEAGEFFRIHLAQVVGGEAFLRILEQRYVHSQDQNLLKSSSSLGATANFPIPRSTF